MVTLLVCGFGRCGSSLTMQMLAAGGAPTTGLYPSFEDEATMAPMPERAAWYRANAGRAIKVLDPHIHTIPGGLEYRAVWLDRQPIEQAKSIQKFAEVMQGKRLRRVPARARGIERGLVRERHKALVHIRSKVTELEVMTFEQLIETPLASAKRLAALTGRSMDVQAMALVVRARSTKCLSGLLEVELTEEENKCAEF